jgi:Tol biopolymer transport system component
MTPRAPVELTDRRIEAMLAARAGSRLPADLVDAIVNAVAVAPQRSRGKWFAIPTTARSRTAWLLVGLALALLAVAAASVGLSRLRPQTPIPGGGGLIVIDQVNGGSTACCEKPTSMQVFGFDVATGQRVEIADLASLGSVTTPSADWLPDRRHVLLFDIDGYARAIVDTATRALTTPIPYREGTGDRGSEIWGPSGDRVARMVYGSANSELAILDLSGSEVDRIPLDIPSGFAGGLAWSPDGSAIVLTGCRPCFSGSKEAPMVIGHQHLYVVPLDGSPVRELLDETGNLGGPAWSPDGASIAASTDAGIVVVDLPTGRQELVSSGRDDTPKWSPDGRRIAFTHRDKSWNVLGISIVDRDGAHPADLTSGYDGSPAWSPDGEWLVFQHVSGDPHQNPPSVWVISASGGVPRLIALNATADW